MVYVCNFSSPRFAEMSMYVISRGVPPPGSISQLGFLPVGKSKNVKKYFSQNSYRETWSKFLQNWHLGKIPIVKREQNASKTDILAKFLSWNVNEIPLTLTFWQNSYRERRDGHVPNKPPPSKMKLSGRDFSKTRVDLIKTRGFLLGTMVIPNAVRPWAY